jgi:hypothetical protein
MNEINIIIKRVIKDIEVQEKRVGSKSWKQIAIHAKSFLSLALSEFEPDKDCIWTGKDSMVGEVWTSDCGEEHIHTSPSDNNFTYCPFCGRNLDYIVDLE